MKLISLICITAVMLSCSSSKNNSMTQTSLNGTWHPVHQEIGGNALPAGAYKTQQLIIDGDKYTVMAESTDKGLVEYHEGDKMDIYGKEGVNAGKHFTAVYKLENGTLTVCYNLAGDSYPTGFSTAGHPLWFLSVFEK